MPYRLTKIYTRTGDDGSTSLGKLRVSKDDPLISVLGALDELNAAIGLILAHDVQSTELRQALMQIQHELFDCGAELFMPERVHITGEKVTRLEQDMDQWNAELPKLEEFLLPGGNLKSAHAHQARTICRRAERSLVHLHKQNPIPNPELLRYINRLSDWLFVAARMLAKESGDKEIMWGR